MRNRFILGLSVTTLVALQACTNGQINVQPNTIQANLSAQSKLQFAVGTANVGGIAALNTVVTFRQTNGLSAVLLDTPTITGPAGFVVPSVASAGTNALTNTISGSAQVPVLTPYPATTFNQSGGAFAYGFAPINATTTGAASFSEYGLPFYAASSAQLTYYLGPGNSFVSNFRTGTQDPGFHGYASGFTDFLVAPVAGAYGLSVNVPTGNAGTIAPFSATATLSSTAILPSIAAPTYVSDGAGGASITFTVPAGVTEALVYIRDTNANSGAVTYYTLLTRNAGAQSLVLPANLGPITGGVASATVPVGDAVSVNVVGFDYPAIEASPIGANPPQAPTITGANGQADITVSPKTSATE